jgi:acetyl-CoA C-acetyltransferase
VSAEELTVTAGNASSLNDGASAVVVVSEAYARAHGLRSSPASPPTHRRHEPAGPVLRADHGGAEPDEEVGHRDRDYDLIEANEAFASQALATGQGLDWAGTA